MAWFVAHSLATLYAQYEEAYPGRSKAADGTIGDAAHAARTSDHNPLPDGEVCARDFTNDPDHGFVSDAQARYLAEHRDSRVKYIISNGRIFSRENGAWAWRPYNGPNGHFHHFHLSVYPDTNATRWNILMPPEEKPPVANNEEDSMVMVQAGSGIVLIAGDQRYGLNITQVRELIAQGVKVVKFDTAALSDLGNRILAGTPTE